MSLSKYNLPPNISPICSKHREKHVVSEITGRNFMLLVRHQCNDYFAAITDTDDHASNDRTAGREHTDSISIGTPH